MAFDFDAYRNALMNVESGGDPNAKNPRSSAYGRYQFLDGTRKGLLSQHPDLNDIPDEAAREDEMFKRFTDENRKVLRGYGFEDTPANAYTAHFFGPEGARKVLASDPKSALPSILPEAVIKANPQLAKLTAGQLLEQHNKKFGGTKVFPQEYDINAVNPDDAVRATAPGLPAAQPPVQLAAAPATTMSDAADPLAILKQAFAGREKSIGDYIAENQATFAGLREKMAEAQKPNLTDDLASAFSNLALSHASVAPGLYATRGGVATGQLPNAQALAAGPKAMIDQLRQEGEQRRSDVKAQTDLGLAEANVRGTGVGLKDKLASDQTQLTLSMIQLQSKLGSENAQFAFQAVKELTNNPGAQAAALKAVTALGPNPSRQAVLKTIEGTLAGADNRKETNPNYQTYAPTDEKGKPIPGQARTIDVNDPANKAFLSQPGMVEIKPPSTQVNIGGENEWNKARAKSASEAADVIYTQGESAKKENRAIQTLLPVLKDVDTGAVWGSDTVYQVRRIAADLGIKDANSMEANELARNVRAKMELVGVQQMRGLGALSDKEGERISRTIADPKMGKRVYDLLLRQAMLGNEMSEDKSRAWAEAEQKGENNVRKWELEWNKTNDKKYSDRMKELNDVFANGWKINDDGTYSDAQGNIFRKKQ